MEKKILIVDDALFARVMLKNALAPLDDVMFFEAGNGQEACDIYRKEKPDLVLMDISMPVMNGMDALKEIRREDPEASVIMCTAVGQEVMIVEAVDAGAKEFIVKPFKPEQILDAAKKFLEKSER